MYYEGGRLNTYGYSLYTGNPLYSHFAADVLFTNNVENMELQRMSPKYIENEKDIFKAYDLNRIFCLLSGIYICSSKIIACLKSYISFSNPFRKNALANLAFSEKYSLAEIYLHK